MDIDIHRGHLDSALVNAVRSIYYDSFPASERVDFSELIADVVRGQRQLFTVKIDGNVVGFAVIMPLPNTGFALLEYIAVHNSMRNQGIGSASLEAVVARAKIAGDVQGLVLEVEPIEPGPESEKEIRKRRILFYLRHGARPVECATNYCIPNLETGQGSIPMVLLWIPFSNEMEAPSGPILEACIRGIYRHSYGRAEGDAILEGTLQNLNC